MVSKLFQEIDQKVTAFEQLEQMMKVCDYQIHACNCLEGDYTLHYSREKHLWFIIWRANDNGNSWTFVTLAQALIKFSELTEH